MVNLLSNSKKASKQDFKLNTMRNKLRQTHSEPEKNGLKNIRQFTLFSRQSLNQIVYRNLINLACETTRAKKKQQKNRKKFKCLNRTVEDISKHQL